MATISGEIPAGSTQANVALPVGASDLRCALFSSSLNWRMVEICADGSDVNYDVPVYTATDENQIVVDVAGPATHVRFTGAAGDKYGVVT